MVPVDGARSERRVLMFVLVSSDRTELIGHFWSEGEALEFCDRFLKYPEMWTVQPLLSREQAMRTAYANGKKILDRPVTVE